MKPIFVVVPQRGGMVDDTPRELISVAKRIDSQSQPTAITFGSGPELEQVCAALTSEFLSVWKIAGEQVASLNAEAVRLALTKLVPAGSIVLCSHEHFGMDLAPGLSVKLGVPYVPDIVAVEESGKLVRQEFSGQFHTRVQCELSGGGVLTVRPGAFKAGSPQACHGTVIDKSAEVGPITVARRYLTTIPAQAGDVDITKQPVLVSVGRGLQEKENLALAEELAQLLGGSVSCSRPVVDAKWLDKSRQVGSSGATVSPKVYLACGISGSFQHMAGIKGAPFLIAINKNPAAPIFQFADVGIVDDVLEFLPAMSEHVRTVLAVKSTPASV